MPSIESHSHAVPSTILLATDLSARCDRALARALQLARQWNARLVVTTVLPDAAIEAGAGLSQHASSERDTAERRLQRLLEDEDRNMRIEVRVTQGHVGRALLQLAAEEGCGLLVTGIASDTLFELPVLGSTVLWLSRHSPLPVLIVHDRVRGAYRHLAVASDFSDSANQAASHALSLLGPPLRLSLVHALESSGSPLLGSDRASAQEQAREAARGQAQEVLAELRPLLAQARAETHIDDGAPAAVLLRHTRASGAELVIVATHGRGALFELLIGSVARRLVAVLETDTLLIRDPRSLPAATAVAGVEG